MGEHSPCDALVPSIVAEYAIIQNIDEALFSASEPSHDFSQADGGTGWQRLDWVTDTRVELECAQAEERAKGIIADSDDSVLWFDAYGADWIKRTGELSLNHCLVSSLIVAPFQSARLSPDGYVQMALQLAWFKTRGTFTATYETVLTRLFDRGRTETIRTLTADSRAFVLAMMAPSSSVCPLYCSQYGFPSHLTARID